MKACDSVQQQTQKALYASRILRQNTATENIDKSQLVDKGIFEVLKLISEKVKDL